MNETKRFDLIAFDADDTLWHEERKYVDAEQHFIDLLTPYRSAEEVRAHLHKHDVQNLSVFGYGVKGFVLSMIETAVAVTEGQVNGHTIQQIVNLGREMLAHPIECFPHVETTLANLHRTHTLMVITKGDLFDQESKIARSGLAAYFDHVAVVSNKLPQTYAKLLAGHGVRPERFMMVGNALKSDILPVVEIGGYAVHIPAGFSWAHEHVELDERKGFAVLDHIGQLATYVAQLEGTTRATPKPASP